MCSRRSRRRCACVDGERALAHRFRERGRERAQGERGGEPLVPAAYEAKPEAHMQLDDHCRAMKQHVQRTQRSSAAPLERAELRRGRREPDLEGCECGCRLRTG